MSVYKQTSYKSDTYVKVLLGIDNKNHSTYFEYKEQRAFAWKAQVKGKCKHLHSDAVHECEKLP